MKKIFLLLLSLSLFSGVEAQKNKFLFYQLAQGGTPVPSTSLTSVTYSIDTINYTNEPIDLVATPNVATLYSKWEITDENGDLVGLEFGNSVSIHSITNPGYYNITYEGLTATDRIIQTWQDMLVLPPRFTEAEADLVINMASGNYYNDFASADNTGLKIYLKGTGTGYFAALNLHGSAGWENHVRIQVDDSGGFNQTGVSGSDAISFGGARYVTIDGFKADKTQGWSLTNPTGSHFEFRCENILGGVTDLVIAGLKLNRTGASTDRAGISIIPPVNVTYNATNWVYENIAIYNCWILNPGAEGIYLMYTNDTPQSTYIPPKARNVRIVYNMIVNAGNDAIQFSSCINAYVHHNYCNGWGAQNSSSHENMFSTNEGNGNIWVHSNYGINGNMGISAKSGITPWDIEGGGSTPLPSYYIGNTIIRGTPPGTPTSETQFNYIQTNNSTGDGTEWPVYAAHNNFFTPTQTGISFATYTNNFNMDNFVLINNVFVKNGGANEYTLVGTNPASSPVVNNVVRNYSSYADLNLTSATDMHPTSLSSPQFTGASTTTSYISGMPLQDNDGYPLLANSYVHGAYNLYNLQTISPTVADGAAATITTPVAVGSLTDTGGTITYEANKEGLLYWVVVADGAGAPSISQIKTGGYLASGKILDGGTAQSGTITGLPTPGTAYDLYYVFTTKYYVDGTATKVDFTTTADVVAPTLSGWQITDAQPGRIYFNSSEVITATTFSGFTIGSVLGTVPTVTGVTINAGQTTGHYFTMSANFGAIDYNATIAYSGSGSNLQDASANALDSFTATSITNAISATRINVNIKNSDANHSGNWNNPDIAGSGAVRTLTANLIDNNGASTGYALSIFEAFHNQTSIATTGGGLYLDATVGGRGVECYSTAATSNAGTFRISGLPSGATGQIVYGTKGIFNVPTGTVLVTGGSAVAFANAYTEYRQNFVADVSGNLDITMTQTTSNASICMVGFIVEVDN